MSRTPVLTNPKKVLVSLEGELHRLAKKRANELRLSGGLSEYISRLLVRDEQRKISAAEGVSRHLPKRRKAA